MANIILSQKPGNHIRELKYFIAVVKKLGNAAGRNGLYFVPSLNFWFFWFKPKEQINLGGFKFGGPSPKFKINSSTSLVGELKKLTA